MSSTCSQRLFPKYTAIGSSIVKVKTTYWQILADFQHVPITPPYQLSLSPNVIENFKKVSLSTPSKWFLHFVNKYAPSTIFVGFHGDHLSIQTSTCLSLEWTEVFKCIKPSFACLLFNFLIPVLVKTFDPSPLALEWGVYSLEGREQGSKTNSRSGTSLDPRRKDITEDMRLAPMIKLECIH